MALEAPKTKDPFLYFNNIEGLNTQSTRYGKNSNQCLEGDNIVFVKRGFQNRGGQLFVNTNNPAGSPSILYALEFLRTVGGVTTRKKIGFASDGNVYDYSTDPPTSVLAGLTPGAMPDVIVTRGWLCFANGVDTPRKWNMTTWYQWGITAPGTAPTLALGGAGNPNGTYRFRVDFRRNPLDAIDPGAQSSMGTISGSIAAVNQIINLTNIPTSADPQVNARDVYVEIAGQWYLATTINDNVTTVFAYNLLDSTVVLNEKGRTDRDPPLASNKIIALHKDIVFGTDGRILYWTILNEFEAFSTLVRASNAFQTDDGTFISALNSFTDLAVCKERSIYVRTGDDVSYSITKKVTDSGVIARNSVVVKDNILYYLAHDGFRVFDGNSSSIISRNINNLLYGTTSEKIIYSPNVSKVCGVYYSNNNIESIIWTIPTLTTGQTYTKSLCYYPGFTTTDSQNQTVGSWISWSNLDARFIFKTINSTTLNDNLFTAGISGRMNQVDTGFSDNGTAITCIYRQADQFFDRPIEKKRMRDAYFSIYSNTLDFAGSVTCEWYIDGAASGVVRSLSFFGVGTSFFDTAIFNASTFAQEGDLIAHDGYTCDPFYTIAPRLKWTVTQASDSILWQGWTLRILFAGYRRTPD